MDHLDMSFIGDSLDNSVQWRTKDDDQFETRSETDNLEVTSADDQEIQAKKSSKKKKFHRHTQSQIQELEAFFQKDPHPDEKTRLELSRRLGLEARQVKFWFQNRRTQMKTQIEHHENTLLKQENDKLRNKNISMQEAMRNAKCTNCGSLVIPGDVSNISREHHLRFENERLRDELQRVDELAHKFLGKPLSSLADTFSPMISNREFDLAVGRNGLSSLNSIDPGLPIEVDFGNEIMVPPSGPSMEFNGLDMSFDKSAFLELATAAMDELVKLVQLGKPLWDENPNGRGDLLNLTEYNNRFPSRTGKKPDNFETEGTRATGDVMINSLALVNALMDANQWTEMFPCIIGKASTSDVIFPGMVGNQDGVLQLMDAEFQVLLPFVPVRQVKFLRYCKHVERSWVVVDVSVDVIYQGPNAHASMSCLRLPSGCLIQDMPNSCSKVTWVEHTEYDKDVVHPLYWPLLKNGRCFGAEKWVASLQRQCQSSIAITSPAVSNGDSNAGLAPSSKSSIANMSQRMVRTFCTGICATVNKWDIIPMENADNVKVMVRKNFGNPGEPSGVVLCATMTFQMPVTPQDLFNFLRNEKMRSHWDILSRDIPMQQMFHIPNGQGLGNSISLLATSDAANVQQSMMILQETCMDDLESLVIHAAVDSAGINAVMSGGDSSCVPFLPSGFAIVPYPFCDSSGVICNESEKCSSLLTIGFQILMSSVPVASLTRESIDTVRNFMMQTLQGINTGIQHNTGINGSC